MREQVRLDNRWQTRQVSAQRSDVFVPAPWAGKQVVLHPARGQAWTGANVKGEELHRSESGEWMADPIEPGAWNVVRVEGGTLDGARLIATERVSISTLEASVASDRSLSVRLRLSDGAQGPVTIVLTVTGPDGRQVGGTEVMLSRKTRELSVAIPLPTVRSGDYRLKATVSDGDHVVDNARIEVRIP